MAQDLIDHFPEVTKPILEEANEALGFNLQKIMKEGPQVSCA
jgi:hypothetical protein